MLHFEGKTVIVAGGTGEVGEGIVSAFLQSGAKVIVPSRDKQKLNNLSSRLGQPEKLIGIQANIGSEKGGIDFRNELLNRSILPDSAVASLGGWWSGSAIIHLSLSEWQRVIDMGLTAHFLFAKTMLPVLAERPESSYTLINGAGGLQPVEGSGPVSVSASAQIMLKEVLAAEIPKVRINTLLLATPVITRSRPQGLPNWITAQDAGKYAVYLASSFGSHIHGETVLLKNPRQLDRLIDK